MKKLNKNWLIVIILIAVTVTFTGYFLFKQRKYSIREITADNYEDLLSRNYLKINSSGIGDVLNKNIGTEGSLFCVYFNQNARPYNKGIVTQSINDLGETITEIIDKRRDLTYGIARKNNNSIRAWVGKTFIFPNNEPNAVKKIMTDLIIDYGFVLKRSELTKGKDILIREDKNCYMIVSMASKFDNCVFFDINTYSKK